MKTLLIFILSIAVCDLANADTFGVGANAFNIDFVTIGNPGNAPDISGDPISVGAVPYTYRIAKYEVSAAMIDRANSMSAAAANSLGITRSLNADGNTAAWGINWYEAATFVNWLDTSTGHVPAYKFDQGSFEAWQPSDAGYNPNNVIRNSLATYYLPSEDEWYKAAYYDPALGVYYDYPTGSNTLPTSVTGGTAPGTAVYSQPGLSGPAEIMNAGGLSPYGTMAQGGNVWEWLENPIDYSSPLRYYRGTAWPNFDLPNKHFAIDGETIGTLGIRVASAVPEPCTLVMFVMGAGISVVRRRTTAHNRV